MTNAPSLEKECRVFTRYLLGVEADAAVIDRYQAAMAALPTLTIESAWDRALLSLARTGTFGVRCADSFAALFAKSSMLRKRLVMLLAILETRAPYFEHIDRPIGGSLPLVIARVALSGTTSALLLVVGALILIPMRLVLGGPNEPAR